MPKENETRRYPVSDGDLKQLADALANSITRDIAPFTTRRITATQVTALKALITSFDTSTTDEEYLGQVTTATEAKEVIVENLKKAIRPIRSMADIAYDGKGKYNTFGFDDLSKQSDTDLYRMARRIVRVGTQLQADLTLQGLTPAQLTALTTLANQLDNAIDAIGTAKEARDLQTQDRIIKGNALWTEMSRLASIGRSLFEDTDEALYNDYVLVGGGSAPKDNPPVVGGEVV